MASRIPAAQRAMAEGKLVLERIAICHQLGFFLDDEAATKNRPTSSSNGPLAVNLFLARMIVCTPGAGELADLAATSRIEFLDHVPSGLT